MRRIFLHAGEPKTGTSAIQLLLHENREVLERFGYLVAKAGASGVGNHAGLIASILGEPVPPSYAGCVEAFRKEIDAHPADTVIVSAERLDYDFRSDHKRERILAFLRELGLATTIVMFVRPDGEALSAAYGEQVKSFLHEFTMRQFALRQRRYIHLLKLAQLAEVETIFRPYDAEVRRRGAGREFLRVIGLPEAALQALGPERRVNESIGPIAIAAAREVRRRIQENGRQPTDQQRRALKAELLRLIAQEDPEPAFYGADPDLLREIDSRMAADREQFAQAAWGKSAQEVFAPALVPPKQCNEFDRATAEPKALKKYERMTAALWSAAQRIMKDPEAAKRNPWDRLHTRGGLQPVFIVGPADIGTSWLLRVLSAHPHVLGIGDIHLVSAACDLESGRHVLAPAEERLRRFFDKSMCSKTDARLALPYPDVGARLEQDEAIPPQPWNRSEPRKLVHLSAATSRGLYKKIAAAETPEDALEAFLDAMCGDIQKETHLVVKSGEPAASLAFLETWQPKAKKIVVVRDGRDAALAEARPQGDAAGGSAPPPDYWQSLRNWADQADVTLASIARRRVYLVRYEDLANDFTATIQRLLQWLQLTQSKWLLERLQKEIPCPTSIDRPMAESAVGEWRTALPPDEQERAWHMAGEQLRAFGYTRDGSSRPLPDLATLEEQPYRLQRRIALEQEVAALRAQVSELESELKTSGSRRPDWTRPIESVLQAARSVSKHLARIFGSLVTILPACTVLCGH